MTRCATNLEERVNHEDCPSAMMMNETRSHDWKPNTWKEAQVVLEDREVIDQLLDDQMNHVSPVKRVY